MGLLIWESLLLHFVWPSVKTDGVEGAAAAYSGIVDSNSIETSEVDAQNEEEDADYPGLSKHTCLTLVSYRNDSVCHPYHHHPRYRNHTPNSSPLSQPHPKTLTPASSASPALAQPSFDFVYRVTLHLTGFKVRDKYSLEGDGKEVDELWPSVDEIIEFDESEEFYQSRLTSPTLVRDFTVTFYH